MKMKKIVSLLVGLVMLFSNLAFAMEGDYTPKIPKLAFIPQEEIPEAVAGGSLNMVIDYKNDSNYNARNITITPSFEDVPLVYERPIVYEAKNLGSKKQNTASFSFKVKDEAKIGVYPIKFKLEYKNNSDENYSSDAIAYFRVTQEKVQSIITINNVVTEPENIAAGEKFNLKFNINNMGDVTANNVMLSFSSLSTDTFMPANGTDTLYVGNLEPKASRTLSISMIASENIKKGSNSIGVNVSYLNSSREEVKEDKNIYILGVVSDKEQTNDDEPTSSKPKIIIESYNTSPNSIVAGNTFSFTFNFKNTSKEKAIKNMKITISSDEEAFMIANGSNTFYIESLEPQAVESRTISLNVKQDLTSKSYPINIDFDYEDASNTAYQSKEIINIPVVEYSNLVINSVYVGEGMVNNETNLSFDYINMGKAKVSNLTASVEGDYTSTQSINYIGNLEAGSTDYYDIQVTPTKEGENVGTLVLTFEDSSGKKIEVRKEFTGVAMSESFFDPGMDNMEGPDITMPEEPIEEPFNVWMGVGVGIGSFLIAFFVTKIITTKIIRKKLEDEI